MKYKYTSKLRVGFTLVELLVVLGLFSGIATLALGSLFNVQSINAKLQTTQTILDNVNLSVSTISREIHFGSRFHCVATLSTVIPRTRKSCPKSAGGGSVLILKPSDASTSTDRVAFYLQKGVLYKDEYYGGGTTTLQMTANDVFISSLVFYVNGAQTSDGSNDVGGAQDYEQPSITLLISGKPNNQAVMASSSEFNIQTTVSPTEIDGI